MIRLFRISFPSSAVALAISEAALAFTCYILAAYLVLDSAPDLYLLEDGGIGRIAIVVAVILAGLFLYDLYGDYRIRSRIVLLQQISLVLGVGFVLQALLSYGESDLVMPKWTMLTGSLMALLVLPAWRMLFTGAVWRSMGARTLLFAGAPPASREVIELLAERPDLGLVAVGYLEEEPAGGATIAGIPCLGSVAELLAAVADKEPDRVVVGLHGRPPAKQLLELRHTGIQLEDARTTYEALFHRVSFHYLGPSRLVFSNELNPAPLTLALRAVLSRIVAVLCGVPLLPAMAAAALALKLSAPGRVVLADVRVGMRGVPFRRYRLRRGPPRWVEKFHLEAVPQLWNVIRGDMSISGPRPERPECARYLSGKIPFYNQRHLVKPGVTGWAQIHQDPAEMNDAVAALEYDLYYIKNLAVSIDAYILLHTLRVLFFGRPSR